MGDNKTRISFSKEISRIVDDIDVSLTKLSGIVDQTPYGYRLYHNLRGNLIPRCKSSSWYIPG